jgi:hypothetical protein
MVPENVKVDVLVDDGHREFLIFCILSKPNTCYFRSVHLVVIPFIGCNVFRCKRVNNSIRSKQVHDGCNIDCDVVEIVYENVIYSGGFTDEFREDVVDVCV